MGRLSDDQLIGALRAARRQENREAWKKTLVIAEFARRRSAELAAAEARGVPVHCRPGQFPGEELTMELLVGLVQAAHAIDDAADLTTRLPATLAGMSAGLIDEARAGTIALHTRCLSAADAALADGILAALAPTLRLDQLARKAAALEMKLAPEAVRARREHARRTRQRVEVRREDSGNASVATREMDTGDALAARTHIHATALRLRRAGIAGTLDQLRVLVFADLTAGRDPLDRLGTPPVRDDAPLESADAPPPEAAAGEHDPNDYGAGGHADDPDAAALDDGLHPSADPPAPVPAAINLLVNAGTLFGWDTAPTEAGGWGLLDAGETRTIVAAASLHPATRWCVTVLGRDGTALAHGCSPGRHPWSPAQQLQPREQLPRLPGADRDTGPPNPGSPTAPAFTQAASLGDFLRRLNVTYTSVAKGGCDHRTAEPRYTPSRRLAHLVRARSVTCDAPGCAAQAVHGDLDHTTPYPDGPTDQCNLGPRCKR